LNNGDAVAERFQALRIANECGDLVAMLNSLANDL
jgi:hypothetical protein